MLKLLCRVNWHSWRVTQVKPFVHFNAVLVTEHCRRCAAKRSRARW